jgi:hypothetical protein
VKLTLITPQGRIAVDTDDPESGEFAFLSLWEQIDKNPKCYLSDLKAVSLKMQGQKNSAVRAHPMVAATSKNLKSARTFRQKLRKLVTKAEQTLPPDNRINLFIKANWYCLTTVPNPNATKPFPGLCAWYPSAAVELMKRAGVLLHDSNEVYDAKWFKKRRQRLGLKPAPKFLVGLKK